MSEGTSRSPTFRLAVPTNLNWAGDVDGCLHVEIDLETATRLRDEHNATCYWIDSRTVIVSPVWMGANETDCYGFGHKEWDE